MQPVGEAAQAPLLGMAADGEAHDMAAPSHDPVAMALGCLMRYDTDHKDYYHRREIASTLSQFGTI